MSGYEYRLRKVNNSIGRTCDVTLWSTPSSITGELAFMNGMIVVFEFQIDREGNLSVREWEWESGIGNVGVALPMMQGESPINTINTTTSERSPTVMQYSYQGMDKDPTAEKPREMIQ